MIRFFDITFSLVGLIVMAPLLAVLAMAMYFSTGSPIFLQVRIGRHQRPFRMVKIRTMAFDTPSVASHLVDKTKISPAGGLLRRSKIDELPQLWNVLRGEMSLVGPRPCLPNQMELIDERAARGVFDFRPGITGLAQISNIDMSTPKRLAEVDQQMLAELSLATYFRYILLTVLGQGTGDRVK
jgi:lipopolysaccharide/colanic/teichoic acid biosynthesis glycosyltransferase